MVVCKMFNTKPEPIAVDDLLFELEDRVLAVLSVPASHDVHHLSSQILVLVQSEHIPVVFPPPVLN